MPYFDFILPTENTPLPIETRNYMLQHSLMLKIIFLQIFTTDHIANFDSTPEHIFPV